MGGECKGKCETVMLHAVYVITNGSGRNTYPNGGKYCKLCKKSIRPRGIRVTTENFLYCPCCGFKMRGGSMGTCKAARKRRIDSKPRVT